MGISENNSATLRSGNIGQRMFEEKQQPTSLSRLLTIFSYSITLGPLKQSLTLNRQILDTLDF